LQHRLLSETDALQPNAVHTPSGCA
jgi:hypothetical protein